MNQKLFPVIQILHGSMITGMILFFTTILFLQNGFPSGETDFSNPLVYVSIFFTVFALAFNYLVYPGRLEKVRANNVTISEKIKNWRTLFLMRCAITEGAALSCIVGMMLIESYLFALLFFANFVLFLSFFPSRNKVQNELELSNEELEMI